MLLSFVQSVPFTKITSVILLYHSSVERLGSEQLRTSHYLLPTAERKS